MKIFYFANNSSNSFFGDPCFHATLQMFRLVDCHNVTCRNPERDIKRPGKAYSKKADVSNHKK